MQRRITIITAVLFVAVVAACNDSTTPLESDGPLLSHKPNHGGGGGPGGGGSEDTTRAVDATFRDDGGDLLVSDGGGAYDATVANWFNLNAKADITPRRLCITVPNGLTPADLGFSDQPGATVVCDDGYINSAAGKFLEDNITADNGTWMSQIPVGSVHRPRWLSLVYNREDYNWNVIYGTTCDLSSSEKHIPTRRPFVTRTLDDTWTIEAATAVICKNPNKSKGKPQPPITVSDSVHMPVFITAVVKP